MVLRISAVSAELHCLSLDLLQGLKLLNLPLVKKLWILSIRKAQSGFEGFLSHFVDRKIKMQTLNDSLKMLGSWLQSEIKPV